MNINDIHLWHIFLIHWNWLLIALLTGGIGVGCGCNHRDK